MPDDVANAGEIPAAEDASRPTRSELRRAREAEHASAAGLSGAVAHPPSTGGMASRLELRRARQAEERRLRSQRGVKGLLKAWWFYPLVAIVLVCCYLGIQSALAPRTIEPPIVVTTPTSPDP